MNGKFKSYIATRLFTDALWWIVLGGIAVVGVAVLLRILLRKPRDLVTVVNVTAPDAMDPMTMGKILDGSVDNEDITSMIYYFAHMGWLAIDLSNEDDPILIRKVMQLPAGTGAHAKTLFTGLFQAGECVAVSDLKYQFYTFTDRAKMQVKQVKMYDKKSVFGYVLGGILGVAFVTLMLWILGVTRLNGYEYGLGIVFAIPVIVHLLLGYIRENYRYKWKPWKQTAMRIGIGVLELVFAIVFIFEGAEHIVTEFEKLFIIGFCYACLYVTEDVLSRQEGYLQMLGDILGFKDFIVYTEEDKIKFMLEENPQLYYKILPYAQVLGVTDEWESKFAKILVEPPYWCYGTDVTMFNYVIFNRTMTHAMATAIQRPESRGGAGVSGAGSGGFGGFGGGGFGGGGFGSR